MKSNTIETIAISFRKSSIVGENRRIGQMD